MIKDISLSLLPEKASNPEELKREAAKFGHVNERDINDLKIIKKSVDARRHPVKLNLVVRIAAGNDLKLSETVKEPHYIHVNDDSPTIIIVGAGPAGLFAALKALEYGIRPLVLERGKDVDARRLDIANISRHKTVDPDSNYCFGEGGAGAFSDGKLYTRSKKRGNVREILETLHFFGASENILIEAHPHIGSDKLPGIIKNIRKEIENYGGKIFFGKRVSDLILENNKILGVRTSDGDIIKGEATILATGHSARDVYRFLHKNKIKIEPKALAIGVRLEHPQSLIDKLQYHQKEGRGKYLPPAEYNFVTQVDGRGVYSFCMCPGGVIVPAMSGPQQLVVNGMSASARSGKWANSGIVVEVHPRDIKSTGTLSSKDDALEMLLLQEKLENIFFEETKGSLEAPAQRMTDFCKGKKSENLLSGSYAPGLYSSRLDLLLPEEISGRLKKGIEEFNRKCKGFMTDEGIMIGLESRTSSPVRIPRDPETLQHIEIRGLYPAGEGAGYAGGIVSAAIDGVRCMESFIKDRTNG